ncbi:hypothetical protein [Borrelia crocidurae]|uniref:Putative lipoprotein n=1 Tax=Borrelia crocidurae (strain Achema) TaxID=1155096 RepID=I0FE09_BORCA|nr:hypothetical protein [Borrelia crocidurae]AFI31715.1 Putative lipoprotein [Borrelia crocidurae str. Achema]
MREVKFNLYLFAIITISCKSGDYVNVQENKKIDLSSKKIVTPAKKVIIPPVIPPSALTVTKTETPEPNPPVQEHNEKVIIPPVIPPSALTVTKTETPEPNPSVQEHSALDSKNKAYIRLKKSIEQYKEQCKIDPNKTVKNTEEIETLIKSLSDYNKTEEYNYIYTSLENNNHIIDSLKKVLEKLSDISWYPPRYNNEANITYYEDDEEIPQATYKHYYEKMIAKSTTTMKQYKTKKYTSLILSLINKLFNMTFFTNNLLYKCLHDKNLARFKSAEKLNKIYDQLNDIMNKRKDVILKFKEQILLAEKHIDVDEVKMVDEIKKIVEPGKEVYSAYEAMYEAANEIWELKYNLGFITFDKNIIIY